MTDPKDGVSLISIAHRAGPEALEDLNPAALETIEIDLPETVTILKDSLQQLLDRAKAVVDLLEDAELNHGGLYSVKTLRAKNELRLELARWR